MITCFEIFIITPNSNIYNIKLVPPLEKKGSGTPDKGKNPIEDAIFNVIWKQNPATIPIKTNLANKSCDLFANKNILKTIQYQAE